MPQMKLAIQFSCPCSISETCAHERPLSSHVPCLHRGQCGALVPGLQASQQRSSSGGYRWTPCTRSPPCRWVLVGEFERLRAEPLDAHHGDESVGQDATDGGVRSEFFELAHALGACLLFFLPPRAMGWGGTVQPEVVGGQGKQGTRLG